MSPPSRRATIERDGWQLVSGEDRHRAHPATFELPPLSRREALSPGDAAKLLFDIEIRRDGHVADRGVHRMWVIVKSSSGREYVGVLAGDPGLPDHPRLTGGDTIPFGPEHVVDIDRPPRAYVLENFGADFFDD